MSKWGIKAVFKSNEDNSKEEYTLFNDVLFDTQKEAELALDEQYDELAQASTIDSENDEQLQGFYLDEIITYQLDITTYRVELEVDEKWFSAINRMTQDVWDGEVCTWRSLIKLIDTNKCETCNGTGDSGSNAYPAPCADCWGRGYKNND